MIIQAIHLKILCFIALFMGLSCASGVRLEDQNKSLMIIRQGIEGVMGGAPRWVSRNQREFHSHYFSRKEDPKFNPTTSRERVYAKFLVLGDRRPYNVEIEVIVQKRSPNGYETIGSDEKLALDLKRELKTRLHQSQDQMNVIDDFRAF
ncbi:MAG: hypothetical protein LW875_07895 [Proteobacteria bacterium]|jgi:hypothetical protein|nr:hypothetical protein [Pseudomonadota bacterium]